MNKKNQPVDERKQIDIDQKSMKSSTSDLVELSRLLVDANAKIAELKAQVNKLQLNESRFQLISANTPDTILFQNKKLVYTWVINATPFIAFEQIIGKRDREILPPDEAKRMNGIKNKLLKEGGSYYEEIRRQNGNGVRIFSLLIRAWQEPSGKIIGVATYSRDITEQKKARVDLKDQLDGERILAEINEQFLMAEIAHSEEYIPAALKKMAKYLMADIGFVRFIDFETKIINRGYEWKNPKKNIQGVADLGISFDKFDLTQQLFKKNQPIFVPEIFAIPDEGQYEKVVLKRLGLNSLVLYPLFIFGQFRGYMGFGAEKNYSFWLEREKGLLGLFNSTIINVLERSEREFSLQESQELYQKILELSPNAIYLLQEDLLLYTNPAGARLAGYEKPEDINGKSYVEIFSPEILEEFYQQSPQPPQKDQIVHGEITINTVQQGRKSVAFSSILFNIKGTPAYLVIGVDISLRKKIEQEIEENRKFLDGILNVSPMAIFVFDREKNHIAYFNPATNQILGLSDQQLQAFSIQQFIANVHPGDLNKAVKMSERLGHLPAGKILEGEYRWICPNGDVRWLHSFQLVVAQFADGSSKQTLNIVQDLSDIKNALQKLRQSEEKYHRLVDNVPGIVYQARCDDIFTTIFLSDYYTKLTAIDKNSLINNKSTNWVDQVHPDDREKIFTAFQQALNGSSSFEVEYRLLKADGTYLWVTDSGRIIYDDEKNPLYINGIITDISTQKRDYEAMKQLSQDNLRLLAQARRDTETKTLLLNEVNHRVKNNIASIIGLIELESQRKIQSNKEFQATLMGIQTRIKGLATVHDILSSNLWAPVKMDLFVRKVIENAAASSPIGRKIAITINCPDQNIWINARQGTALALIINELTTNSIRHAFSERLDGTITVTILRETKARNRVQITFADDGPGWPKDILNGKGGNVGMQVIRLSAVSPLYGEIQFENNGGAVATITFNLSPQILK